MSIEAQNDFGLIAHELMGVKLQLLILKSRAGFYIGTLDYEGPVSRESEYFPSYNAALNAFETGSWTQRQL
ncbi:Uncharacterised protein [Pseudomonas luteola]|uniref:Uncharacterized protein n=1 Tax=Pseudomonas luteola TaxID=47886 RepID=A0A2X2CR93_PSELU|nr:hypothetical protein [Pseudomonas luteola]SPZ02545.1 Uncharacterised protein [Pseudomonas luteola]